MPRAIKKKSTTNVFRPRPLHFLGPPLFFYYLLLEKLERTKPTGVTVNTNYSTILRNRRGVTQFLKTKHLLNESYTDVLKAPYLLRYIV